MCRAFWCFMSRAYTPSLSLPRRARFFICISVTLSILIAILITLLFIGVIPLSGRGIVGKNQSTQSKTTVRCTMVKLSFSLHKTIKIGGRLGAYRTSNNIILGHKTSLASHCPLPMVLVHSITQVNGIIRLLLTWQ